MSKNIRTTDAKEALQQIVTQDALQAAAGNTLISQTEKKQLQPFVAEAEAKARAAAGPGGKVKVAAVVEQAMKSADALWATVNTQGKAYLSQAEVKAVTKANPALGELTARAYGMVKSGTINDPKNAVQFFFQGHDFTNMFDPADFGGVRIDVRPGQPGRAGIPANVLKVFDHYYQAEQSDWASVRLVDSKIGDNAFYITFMSTDGDDKYLEAFNKGDGSYVTSARINADKVFAWDTFEGQSRLVQPLIQAGDWATEEGLSEPAEIAAAGQIPKDFQGDVTINKGEVHTKVVFGTYRAFTHVELPSDVVLTNEQRDVLYAAMEIIFSDTLRHRVDGDAPLLLGPQYQGSLNIGTFTRPNDGKTYIVANWRDIDDASATLYFQRSAETGQLNLSILQQNG